MVGNGPSLRDADLGELTSLSTMTFNRSYLAWDEWPFEPTYYVCVDPNAVLALGKELRGVIQRPGLRSFLNRNAADFGMQPADGSVEFCEIDAAWPASASIARLRDFGNTGANSLQILAALGYRRVLMIGVDALYTTKGDEGAASGLNDPDHFRSDYRRGLKPVSGDLERFSSGWGPAAEFCANASLEVRNASSRSELQCFPRCTLGEGLNWLRELVH